MAIAPGCRPDASREATGVRVLYAPLRKSGRVVEGSGLLIRSGRPRSPHVRIVPLPLGVGRVYLYPAGGGYLSPAPGIVAEWFRRRTATPITAVQICPMSSVLLVTMVQWLAHGTVAPAMGSSPAGRPVVA